jgi:hypothetical protein
MTRDNKWLKQKMEAIWSFLFQDVERKNNVVIRFKGKWKNKFGHIKILKNKDTEIAVNGLFKNEVVPEEIVDLTIAHEIVHYAHGFNSPHPKLFKYPHQGGIVRKELIKRGFGSSMKEEKKFIKKWPEIYRSLIRK